MCLRRSRGISLHGTRSMGRLLRQELARVLPFEAILFLIGPDLNGSGVEPNPKGCCNGCSLTGEGASSNPTTTTS